MIRYSFIFILLSGVYALGMDPKPINAESRRFFASVGEYALANEHQISTKVALFMQGKPDQVRIARDGSQITYRAKFNNDESIRFLVTRTNGIKFDDRIEVVYEAPRASYAIGMEPAKKNTMKLQEDCIGVTFDLYEKLYNNGTVIAGK